MNLKFLIISLFLIFISSSFVFSQNIIEETTLEKRSNKHRFYIFWGWNRGYYSKSDIAFKGDDYQFKLYDVIAKDRQSDFSFEKYFKPSSLTVPQTNFGVGYFLNHHYILSLSFDHMKYVVQNRQEVTIDGQIGEFSNLYNKIYDNEKIFIRPSFLQMEHTDGLNYVNLGISRADNLFEKIHSLKNKIELQLVEGIEAGVVVPRSDITILGLDDVNKYHLAGWGTSLKTGLHLTLFKNYFLHGEIKGGYINLSDIITSLEGTNRAKQDFFFLQTTFQFGGIFYLK